MQYLHLLLALLGLAAAIPSPAPAQDKPAAGPAEVVVATVGSQPIHARDVDRLLAKATGGRELNPAASPVLKAQVLAEIVDRRLVMAYARRTGLAPSKAEVDAALTEVKTKLELEHRSLDSWLTEQGISTADLRRQAAWNFLWPKCLDRYLTDERIERYFQDHRRQFDGSRVVVSHILFRAPPTAGRSELEALARKAAAIRDQIVSEKLRFEEAVSRYSSGPSAAKGGRLGAISRRGAMVESYAAAAFALEPGDLSQPVTTPFGVHLIRCDEIEPGGKRLADVGSEVREALARELLGKLAEIEQRHNPVRFTGAYPHFKPGTKDLVR